MSDQQPQNGHGYSSDEIAQRVEEFLRAVEEERAGKREVDPEYPLCLCLMDCNCTEADVARLSADPRIRETLTNLALDLNWFSKECDETALANALKPLTKLTRLDLGLNLLSDMAALAEALKSLTELTCLWLNDNGFSDADALAEALKPLTKLTELSLEDTGLSDAAGLVKALRPLTELTVLYVGQNKFSDADADVLIEGLMPFTKLTELDLNHNEFSDEIEARIIKAVCRGERSEEQ